MCEINGSKFALFNKAIKSEETLTIDLSDYSIVFLEPIEAEKNISIKAISVISLSTLITNHGETKINATEKIVSLGSKIKSESDNKIYGDKGVFISGVIKERLEMILEEFKKGISNQHGPTIVDALVETFDAIEDPSGENEGSSIDMAHAFEFFNISTEPPLSNVHRDSEAHP